MDIKEIPDWARKMNCGVTVCDRKGIVIYMNDKALKIFEKSGDMRGRSLIPCHSERSRAMIAHMLESGESNSYTIRKGGIMKMIYQTPWRDEAGEVAGLVEISMEIPSEMPFYDRDAQ